MIKTAPDRKPAKRRTHMPCPECGARAIVTVPTDHRFQYGVGKGVVQLTATLPVRRCQSCGFEFLDKQSEVLQHESVCKHLGVMTPAQIRKLRLDLGLSRAEFARLSGLGEATIARWERGSLIQNEANDRYLKLLAHKENLRRLRTYARAKRA